MRSRELAPARARVEGGEELCVLHPHSTFFSKNHLNPIPFQRAFRLGIRYFLKPSLTHPTHTLHHLSLESWGLAAWGDESRCVELLMRGFLCGIAYILPTTEAPVSNFTFELSLYSAPDPRDLVTIPGWRKALILGESGGSPVMCGILSAIGIGEKSQGGLLRQTH